MPFFKRISPIILLVIISCEAGRENNVVKPELSDTTGVSNHMEIYHAENFSVETYPGFTLVEVSNAWQGVSKTYTYALLDSGVVLPDTLEADKKIQVPVKNLVCFSTTHIPYLDMLNVEDRLIAFPNLDYISTKAVRDQIDRGKVEELGSANNPNIEKLMTIQPDLVMAFGMPGGSDLDFKLAQVGIPVVYNADYMEMSPLGRAEWLRFMSLFFKKSSLADSLFHRVQNSYDSLRQLAQTGQKRPSVISGIVYGDAWFLPAGKNYGARFFQDANAHYLWSDNQQKGYLELSFEAVYHKAHSVDFWIGVGTFQTLNELSQADARYENFRAFRQGNVYSYLTRTGPKGGNEYFEMGYARPDIILADLIRIFHPELLPEHQLYFHQKLN